MTRVVLVQAEVPQLTASNILEPWGSSEYPISTRQDRGRIVQTLEDVFVHSEVDSYIRYDISN